MSNCTIIILTVVLFGIIGAYCLYAKARKLVKDHNSLLALVSTFAALIVFVQLYVTIAFFKQEQKDRVQDQENRIQEQQRISLQKLQRVFLESAYNLEISQLALDTYSTANVHTVFMKRLTFAMALLSLQDDNVLSLLPAHKISLLMEYVNTIDHLNRTLDLHIGLALNPDMHKEILQHKDVQFIRTNAAAAVVRCQMLQREFSEYSNKENYDLNRIQILEEEGKAIMEKVLQNKTSFSSENKKASNQELKAIDKVAP